MILCLQCGAQCAENAAFCSACGSKLPKSAAGSALHAEDAAHAAPLPEQSAQYVSIADAEGLTSWLNAAPCPLDFAMLVQKPLFFIDTSTANITLMSYLFNKEDAEKDFNTGIERMYGLHAQAYNLWIKEILGEERAKKYLMPEEILKANFQAFSQTIELYKRDILSACASLRQYLIDMEHLVKEKVYLFDDNSSDYLYMGQSVFSGEFGELYAALINGVGELMSEEDQKTDLAEYNSQINAINNTIKELKQNISSNIHTVCEIIKKEQLTLIQGSLLTALCNAFNNEIKLGSMSFEDIKKALSLAIQKEESDCKVLTADMYLWGISVEPDWEKAYDLFLASAKENCARALAELGFMHQTGMYAEEDPETNTEKMFAYFKKAAELGDAGGMCGLGYCYMNGCGTQEDAEKAAEWYIKAADMGMNTAQVYAAKCYRMGIGVEQSYTKAYELLKRAAEQGDAEAQFSMWRIYFNGLGVQENKQEALTWLHRAAGAGSLDAMTVLGNMYQEAVVVEEDKVLAILYYNFASKHGNTGAKTALGAMYFHDENFKDEDKGFKLLQEAAEEGDSTGQFMYAFALQSKKDYENAFKWFMAAAEQGNADAMNELAQYYEFGIGVQKNKKKAKDLYKLALDNGCAEAKEGYNRLNAAAKSWFSFLSSSK